MICYLKVVILVLFCICSQFEVAHAFDGGDAAALIIGLLIGFLGFCACLGYYARKKAGQAQ